MDAIVWLILMAALLVIELCTLGLTTIWFAAGALAAFIAATLGGPLWLSITLFVVVSLVLLIFTRPVATKYLNSKTTKTNAESIVGQTAKVTIAIDNLEPSGQVVIGGMEWTARSTQDGVKIPEGTLVTVEGISGVKLIVREMVNETPNA